MIEEDYTKRRCEQCTWNKYANNREWCLCPRVKQDMPDERRAEDCFYYEVE